MYLIVSKQSLRATCKKVKPACAFAQTLQMISPCSTTLFGFLSYKHSKKKTSKRTSIRKFTFVNLPKYWSRCCEGKVPLRHSKADIKLPHSQAIQFVQFGAIRSTIKLSFHLVVSLAMCTPLLCLQVEVNLGQLCHYQAQVALTPPQFVLQKNKKTERKKERKKKKEEIRELFINWAHLGFLSFICTLTWSFTESRRTFVNRCCSVRAYFKLLKWLRLDAGYLCAWEYNAMANLRRKWSIMELYFFKRRFEISE